MDNNNSSDVTNYYLEIEDSGDSFIYKDPTPKKSDNFDLIAICVSIIKSRASYEVGDNLSFSSKHSRKLEDWEVVKYRLQGIIK